LISRAPERYEGSRMIAGYQGAVLKPMPSQRCFRARTRRPAEAREICTQKGHSKGLWTRVETFAHLATLIYFRGWFFEGASDV
jgi:hypothetical protein